VPNDDVNTALSQLGGKMDVLAMKIDELKEKQEDMAEDISKVKEAVYHPDEGLYARIRELEGWQKTSTKFTWMLVSSVLGILAFLVTKALS
jgi:FtsZ-binding cell division protein ZapB